MNPKGYVIILCRQVNRYEKNLKKVCLENGQKVFKFDSFRPGQLDVLYALYKKKI